VEATPLDYRREAATSTPEGRAGTTDCAALNGASDAETRYNDAWYEEVARHLDAGGFCLCVKCLGSYCFGTKASADRLVSAMCRRKGIHPMKIAHTGV
jgi:hypothetical protein